MKRKTEINDKLNRETTFDGLVSTISTDCGDSVFTIQN